MKVKQRVEIEEKMANLMGWERAIDEMVDAKREVSRGTPIYELSPREDKLLLFKLRNKYERFKESRDNRIHGYEAISD